jgi:hypothetical protein
MIDTMAAPKYCDTVSGYVPDDLAEEGDSLMYPLSESIFSGTAQDYATRGWAIFPQQQDRRPAVSHGAMIKPISDHHLDQRLPDPVVVEAWVHQCGTSNAAAMMGEGSGYAFTIDIDVLDSDASAAITSIADEILGYTPFRRVGMAPKLALIYRCTADDMILSGSRTIDGTNRWQVEILAAGKAVTFHGKHHKTGCYYKWLDVNPLLAGPEAAPVVTSLKLAEFLNAVDRRFPFVVAAAGGKGAATSWATVDAEGVRVPVVIHDPTKWRVENGKVTDGRYEFLRSCCWQAVIANIHNAEAAKDPATAAVCCTAAEKAFLEHAETEGRWAPNEIRGPIKSDIARMIAKISEGKLKVGSDRQQGAEKPAKAKAKPIDERLPEDRKNLPIIKIEVGAINAAAAAAEDALIKARRGLYQRSGSIVEVGEAPIITSAGREIAGQRIFSVGERGLVAHLDASANFVRFDARKEADSLISPPTAIAGLLLERAGRLRLPALLGVISSPTLRKDGSILDADGYDEASGMLLDRRGVNFPTVPANPTREDAEKALAVLNDLIKTFPFVDRASKSVALAGMMTAVVRRSIDKAPIFAFSAPVAGSGKTKLGDICSVLATGKAAAVLATGSTAEEFEKRLASTLLGGDPVILIDNVEVPLGGELLEMMVTSDLCKPRILGRSETPEISTSALVCATGNNLVIRKDITRRVMLCRLDPQVERPELRQFEYDPVKRARERRPEYVAAALTIMRAWHVSGAPGYDKLGSFEEWGSMVRDALVWLGEEDPTVTIEEARKTDPFLDTVDGVIQGWWHSIGDRTVRAGDIVEVVGESSGSGWEYPDFREAIMGVAAAGNNPSAGISAKRLGRWLSQFKGRIVDGKRIVEAGKFRGQVSWRLEAVDKSQPTVPQKLDLSKCTHGAYVEPVTMSSGPSCAERLHDAALASLKTQERADLWMHSTHPSLGEHPADYCTSENALLRCMGLLRQ